MNFRRVMQLNKRQFEIVLNREGQIVYNMNANKEEKVFFRKMANSSTAQDKISIYYASNSSINKGDIIKFNKFYYLVMNQNYPENEAYRNSYCVKCNTVWDLFGNKVPLTTTELSSPNPTGSFAKQVNGTLSFMTTETEMWHNQIGVDDCFHDFGGCYKLINKFFLEGICYLYFERDLSNQTLSYSLFDGDQDTTNIPLDTLYQTKWYLGTEIADSGAQTFLPVAKLTYKSSDETIATVDEDGIIIPKQEGTVTITVACNYMLENGAKNNTEYSINTTKTFTIVKEQVPVEPEEPTYAMELTKSNTKITIGYKNTIMAHITNPDGEEIATTELDNSKYSWELWMQLTDGAEYTRIDTDSSIVTITKQTSDYTIKIVDKTAYNKKNVIVKCTYDDGVLPVLYDELSLVTSRV